MPAFNPAVPPPEAPLSVDTQFQPLPVELQPQHSVGTQYGTQLTAADWNQVQDDLDTSMAEYAPHASGDPLKWRDQLERKDCPVFSGKSQEDVADWMH